MHDKWSESLECIDSRPDPTLLDTELDFDIEPLEECQAEGPEASELVMLFCMGSAWKAKKNASDTATRPPKRLTTGKHGYRIRKWVK